MFGNTAPNKFGTTSTFGTTSFGAGANTFGQSTPGFGVKQPTSVFGGFGGTAPATSNMFNSTTNTASTGLFGQSTGFGAAPAPASTGFGFGQTTTASTLFGSTSQANTNTGLFGGSSTSAFGTPRPSFGGTFNASTPSLFGQTQAQPTTSLFGQSGVQNTGLFGSTGFSAPTTSGTTLKFNPPTGTDTMMKNGVSTNINTRHQCITCMKEYENKSLEELRVEDYQANRKGPQSVGFGGPMPATGGGLFGNTPATSSFSFNQNKPSLFGSATPGTFGTTSAPSLFGQTAQPATTGLFNKPLSFGTATTTATSAAPFSFGGSTATPLFGQTAQQKPMFGQPQSTGLFGAPATSQASSVFGASPSFGTAFGQTAQQQGGILGLKPAFGAAPTSTATPSFSFGTNTSTAGGNLFGPKLTATATTFPSTTGFQGFSTTPNTGLGLFNQNKPATGFGTTTAFGTTGGLQTGLGGIGSFGSTLGVSTGTSLFGNTATANKPLNFSFGATQPFSTFGNPSATSSLAPFNPTGIGSGLGLGMDANASNLANQMQAQQQILALANYPFSDSPLFKNLIRDTNKREEILKPTNPTAQKAMMSNPKIEAHPMGKLKPKPIQPLVNGKNMGSLFDGLEEEATALSNDTFIPRQSIKKLTIKPKLSPDNSKLDESLLNASNIQSPIQQDNFAQKHHEDMLNSGRNLTALENTISELQPRNTKLFEVAHSISSDHTENDDNDDTSENLNDKNNNSVEKSNHPTGITLSRAGYYTVPSMDELANMIDKDGNCFVNNFAIGRENYGNVCFLGVTNVRGLNLDKIVHFRRKEIVVYLDDDNKPAVGEELNKKAQVTLDHVYPVDKTTHFPITSPKKIIATRFEENLEKASLKLGAKFIEYRPETGSWIFQVPHF